MQRPNLSSRAVRTSPESSSHPTAALDWVRFFIKGRRGKAYALDAIPCLGKNVSRAGDRDGGFEVIHLPHGWFPFRLSMS
jgi:hypothetical protein